MTRIHTLSAGAAVLLACSAIACNNDKLTQVNNNPNAPTTAPATALFTNATESAVSNWLGSGYSLRDIGLLIQHFAEDQYVGNDYYGGVNSTSLDNNWVSVYDGSLEDYQIIVRSATASNSPALWAPALIMQQWEYGNLTDTWGDIPYSQALEADSSSAIQSPVFDTQQSVYTGMFAALTKASTALGSASGAGLGAADPVYGGSAAEWQKFANSLHARDALMIINADPATAAKELQAALSATGGVFTSNADNAVFPWPGDGVFNNPWATNFASRDDDRVSRTLEDTLIDYSDPRLPIYAQPGPATGAYIGQINGLPNAAAVAEGDSSSRPGLIFYPAAGLYPSGPGNSQPSYIMTYAEVAFIEAEAAQRGLAGLTPAQAAGFYNAGITASMQQWGVTDGAKIAAYLAEPQVVYQAGTAGLKQIALQKWIALYSDAGTAWAEWRRTCTPTLVKSVDAIFPYIPRRVLYPSTESKDNPTQVLAAATRIGGDLNNTPVWWDKTSAAPTCQ
jgi:hypothetical protein